MQDVRSKNHCKECGQLTPWSLWSLSFCSKSCGGGEKTRTRSCRHAKKKPGGKHECQNDKIEIETEKRPCQMDPCRE